MHTFTQHKTDRSRDRWLRSSRCGLDDGVPHTHGVGVLRRSASLGTVVHQVSRPHQHVTRLRRLQKSVAHWKRTRHRHTEQETTPHSRIGSFTPAARKCTASAVSPSVRKSLPWAARCQRVQRRTGSRGRPSSPSAWSTQSPSSPHRPDCRTPAR